VQFLKVTPVLAPILTIRCFKLNVVVVFSLSQYCRRLGVQYIINSFRVSLANQYDTFSGFNNSLNDSQ